MVLKYHHPDVGWDGHMVSIGIAQEAAIVPFDLGLSSGKCRKLHPFFAMFTPLVPRSVKRDTSGTELCAAKPAQDLIEVPRNDHRSAV